MARKGRIDIDRERCKGCSLCVRACPAGVLEIDKTPNSGGSFPAVSKGDGCVSCGNCHTVCPDTAISVYRID